jgi:hypothetical protein
MAFNINSFQNALPKGGARPSLFKVDIPLPDGLALPSFGAKADAIVATATGSAGIGVDVKPANMSSERMSLTTQAATIPAGTIDPIEVNYFGRIFKLPGGRTFEDWTTTVLNDEDYSVRSVIEGWMDKINGNVTNKESGNGSVGGSGGNWTVPARVIQYNSQGNATRAYVMQNCWPTMVTEITLDWAEATAIETFDITWAYSHWESESVENWSLDVNADLKIGSVSSYVAGRIGG